MVVIMFFRFFLNFWLCILFICLFFIGFFCFQVSFTGFLSVGFFIVSVLPGFVFDVDALVIIVTNFIFFVFHYLIFFFSEAKNFLFFNNVFSFYFLEFFGKLDVLALVSKVMRYLQHEVSRMTSPNGTFGIFSTHFKSAFTVYEQIFDSSQLFFGGNKFSQMLRLYQFAANSFCFDKAFVYRRSGVLHTQIIKHQITPDDAFDGGHIVRVLHVQREFNHRLPLKELERQPFFSNMRFRVRFLHNYNSVFHGSRLYKYSRFYVLPFPGTTWWFEFFITPLVLIVGALFFVYFLDMLSELFYETEDFSGPFDFYNDTITTMHENSESEIASAVHPDPDEQLMDDDMYLDSILVDWKELWPFQGENSSGYHDYDFLRIFNYLSVEVKTFSVLYPFYRFLLVLMPAKLGDFLSFRDSGKVYTSIFLILLYLPVAVTLSLLKFFLYFLEFFLSLSFTHKFFFFLFCIFFLFF